MDIERILALSRQGYSRRQMALLLGVSRNTLKKHLRSEADVDSPGSGMGRPGKLDTYLPQLRHFLEGAPETRAMEVFHRLQGHGYAGGYDLVKKRMREIRLETQSANADGGFAPGQRAEVDIGKLEVPGQVRFLFSMVCCHSGKLYAEFLGKPDLEPFLNCHQRAFRFFQGVPRELLYEKCRNKWLKRLAGLTRFNLPLIRLAEHYDFGLREAPPYAPWTAGRLKRPLCQVQALFLPQVSLEDVDEANSRLQEWLLKRETVESGSGESIATKFGREKPGLGPLPQEPFSMFPLKLRVLRVAQSF